MAKRTSFILTLWFLILPISCKLRECRRQQVEEGAAAALYVFGDSFLDTGNNDHINTTTFLKANFWPYGQTFFHFPTGRFSDGRLMSDFIAEYAKLPLTRPFLQPSTEKNYYYYYKNGVNFASSGAGALLGTYQGLVISLSEQLNFYKKVVGGLRQQLGDVESNKTLSNAVYLFGIGTNDYTSIFLENSTMLSHYSKSTYVGMVIGNITIAIKEVYGRGGRKFGFLNLGPLGCLPVLRMLGGNNGACLEEASTLAKLHNEALSKMLSELENQLKDFRYALYDFHTNLAERMDHPSVYGFEEGITACCGTGDFNGVFSCGGKRLVKEFELCDNPFDYVFWDSIHLTEEAYEQMAAQMWAGGPNDVKPYNLKRHRAGCNLRGLAIATCCHHLCQWKHYINMKKLLNLGMTRQDFHSITWFTSWAVDADHSSGLPVSVDVASDLQTIGMEEGGKVGLGAEDVLRNIKAVERAVLGFMCKDVIDMGRLMWIKEHGLEAHLVKYVPYSISPENHLLIAKG